jgi:hypothetical protein
MPHNSTQQPHLSLSLFFLKSVVAGLGIVLVVGFAGLVISLVLGMKYLQKKEQFNYNLQKPIHLNLPKDIELLDFKPYEGNFWLTVETKEKQKQILIYNQDSKKIGEIHF